MRKYLTRQGDEWDQIAFDQLGSEHLVAQLIAANPDHSMTVVFAAGVRLTLPEIKISPRTSGPAPWRRVTSVPSAFHDS